MPKSRSSTDSNAGTTTTATTATNTTTTTTIVPVSPPAQSPPLIQRTNSAPLPQETYVPRFRLQVTSTPATEPGEKEIYTTTEIFRTKNGDTRVRIVRHDAKTGVRLTPFLPSSDSASGGEEEEKEEEGEEQEQDCTKVSTDFNCTTAATAATSSPATVVRVREASSDGDTEKAVTDRLEPTSTAATDVRSTDRTEEAQMEGSRREEDYSDTTDSAQEVEDDEMEADADGDEEEDEDEQAAAQYQTRRVENGLAIANKIIKGYANGSTRHQHKMEADHMERDESEEEAEEEEEEEEGEEYDEEDELENEGEDEDHDSVSTDYSEDQSDSDEAVDEAAREEIDNFCRHFKGIDRRFRVMGKIGEGTFSSVYKAEDLLYDRYDNSWDLDASDDDQDRSPPPNKRRKFAETQRRRPKYVAIKKIYVTSSPQRIMNELELLHELRGCREVVPLITAFRHLDQVVAILPYFKHVDFRNYFRAMSFDDMRLYFKFLFRALSHVHRYKIIHRDIKPTNFLYEPARRRGVLVDFGLAEREGTDCSHCPCQHSGLSRAHASITQPTILSVGYIKNDNRPPQRANRAGTRGFRAPEVLFKCTSQTTKIDIWSAGVILLTMLSKRFPFFNSADDVDATIEIATIFGKARMRACAVLHGASFETTIPTIGEKGFTLEKIIMWATNRIAGGGGRDKEKDELREANMSNEEKVACQFLARCLELDPAKRIAADEALEHDFLRGV